MKIELFTVFQTLPYALLVSIHNTDFRPSLTQLLPKSPPCSNGWPSSTSEARRYVFVLNCSLTLSRPICDSRIQTQILMQMSYGDWSTHNSENALAMHRCVAMALNFHRVKLLNVKLYVYHYDIVEKAKPTAHFIRSRLVSHAEAPAGRPAGSYINQSLTIAVRGNIALFIKTDLFLGSCHREFVYTGLPSCSPNSTILLSRYCVY